MSLVSEVGGGHLERGAGLRPLIRGCFELGYEVTESQELTGITIVLFV